jgi:SnoaL-like protein
MASTLEQTPGRLAVRSAMEARDIAAVVDSFAADAVVRSPITGRLTFSGREQITALMGVILEVFEDLHYTDELRAGDLAYLSARARVGGTELEMVDQLRLDEDGKIRELTVFFRPMPAIAVAMRLIGSGLGRRRSAARGAAIAAMTRPLGLITEVGDRIGVGLVKSTL